MTSLNSTVAVVYASFFGAIAVVGVAMTLVGQTFLAFLVVAVGLFLIPNYHETPDIAAGRALTDAEAKAQMVNRLTEHLESEEHQDGCDDECPVPEILEKVT